MITLIRDVGSSGCVFNREGCNIVKLPAILLLFCATQYLFPFHSANCASVLGMGGTPQAVWSVLSMFSDS